MKFATKPVRQYSPDLRHVATLPWEIKNSNFLQIFSCYGRKCKQIAFWVHRFLFHRPLRLAQRKRVENSQALTQPLRPSATSRTSGDSTVSGQRQCCASLCHGVRRRGRSADCQAKRPRTPFCRKEDKVSGRLRELLKQNLSAFHASSTVRVCQLLCTAPFETFQTQVLTVIRDTDDRWMPVSRVISGTACGSAACPLDSTLYH